MANEMVKKDEPRAMDKVIKMISGLEMSLENAFPNPMAKEYFMRAIQTGMRKIPKLAECSVQSFNDCCLTAAQLGLVPFVNGACFILPFKVKGKYEAVFIPGYQGLVDLCYRSGEIEYVAPNVVCENDEFEFELGSKPYIKHRPSLKGDRGAMYAVYATAMIKGATNPLILSPLTKDDIQKVKNSSAAYRAAKQYNNDTVWEGDFEGEMWKKTAIKRIAKLLPKSTKLNRALDYESKFEERIKEIEAQVIESDPLTPGRHDMSEKTSEKNPLDDVIIPNDTIPAASHAPEDDFPHNTCEKYREIHAIMNDGRKRKKMKEAFALVSKDTGMDIKSLTDIGHDDITLCTRILGRYNQ